MHLCQPQRLHMQFLCNSIFYDKKYLCIFTIFSVLEKLNTFPVLDISNNFHLLNIPNMQKKLKAKYSNPVVKTSKLVVHLWSTSFTLSSSSSTNGFPLLKYEMGSWCFLKIGAKEDQIIGVRPGQEDSELALKEGDNRCLLPFLI